MEENNNVEKENNKKVKTKVEVDTKTKRKKAKIAVISLCTIVVVILGLQVYASTSGHGNVFFLIKDWVTGTSSEKEEEIFSDQEITLSYKSIDLEDGLKIQINRLEVKDGKTKIYTKVQSNKGDILPLEYRIDTQFTDGAATTQQEIIGTKPSDTDNYYYEDVLTLDYAVNEKAIIKIKILDNKDKVLRTLEINLETREITVTGETALKKISKIELKKYLDIFSELNNNQTKGDTLVMIAKKIQDKHEDLIDDSDYTEAKQKYTNRGFINAIIKEVYGDKAEFEFQKQANSDVEVVKGLYGWEFDKTNDEYKQITAWEEYQNGHCLKIEDVSYEKGIYTIKYIYTLATGIEEDAATNDNKLEELPQYEATIKLKRDDNQLYSKYQVINITDGTVVKEKVSAEIEEDTELESEEVIEIFNDIEDTDDENETDFFNGEETLRIKECGGWFDILVYNQSEPVIKFTNSDISKVFGENVTINYNKKGYYIEGIYKTINKVLIANIGGGVNPIVFFILEDGDATYIKPFDQIIDNNYQIPNEFKVDMYDEIELENKIVDLKIKENEVIAITDKNEEIKIRNRWEKENGNTTNSNTSNFDLEKYLDDRDNARQYIAVPGYVILQYDLGYTYLEPEEDGLKTYLHLDSVKIPAKRCAITGARGTIRNIYDYDNYKGTVGSMAFFVYGTGDVGYMTPYDQIKNGVVPETFEIDGYINLNLDERVESLETDSKGDLYAVMENSKRKIKIWNRGEDKPAVN